jgi:23S rRNA (pseudouridine1915-N3)-methyltransferase
VKITLICVGRLKDGPERLLVARYLERSQVMIKKHGFAGLRLLELAESRARRDEDRRAEEAQAILAACDGPHFWVLDEKGEAWSSQDFARNLVQRRDRGEKALSIIIGGADGLDPALRARAGGILAFGAATIPHQIVRILLAEQLYRAMTIMAGHPYHRDA